VPGADDDLEPLPLTTSTPATPAPASTPAVRDRFLVALAVVVALAIVAFAVQVRSIARDAAHEAECSEALVAIVSSGGAGNDDARAELEAKVRECLGPDATLPKFGRG
jgi:hypothetical protein